MLDVSFDPGVVGKTPRQAICELGDGTPQVLVRSDAEDKLTLSFHTMHEGQELVVGDRLHTVLSG